MYICVLLENKCFSCSEYFCQAKIILSLVRVWLVVALLKADEMLVLCKLVCLAMGFLLVVVSQFKPSR